MTEALSLMEYPHWMMVAGAVLVAVGFIGLAFHRNGNVENRPENERAEGAHRKTPVN
jgi:hypothetical protein